MTAADKAYGFTKVRILDGRFAGGRLISEADVAADVKLSRTPVREAFVRLETEGLLVLYPKRGALVVPVSPDEIESVMEVRLLVERFAVERVIETGVDVTKRLERAIERQRVLAERGAMREFIEADRRFHRVLLEGAGNPILLDLHDSIRDRQSRMNLVAITRYEQRVAEVLEQHCAIAAAVRDADAERARAELDEHLRDTLSLLRGTPVVAK